MLSSKIFEYKIASTAIDHSGFVDIQTHHGAVLLDAGEQDGNLVVWFMVIPDYPSAPYRIQVIMTGHAFQAIAGARFVRTVQFDELETRIVLHVFDVGPCGPV